MSTSIFLNIHLKSCLYEKLGFDANDTPDEHTFTENFIAELQSMSRVALVYQARPISLAHRTGSCVGTRVPTELIVLPD